MNKVSVNIYDREYTIMGEKSPEEIIRVAVHVDGRMKEIDEVTKNSPVSHLAVLSAVNIAEEYFDAIETLEALKRTNEQMDGDINHYVELWEEAKKTFISYKEDSQNEMRAMKIQREQLEAEIREKDRDLEALVRNQIDATKGIEKVSQEAVNQWEIKYKDIENSFFDLQMENIQLKSELEKLKNKLEWERNERQSL